MRLLLHNMNPSLKFLAVTVSMVVLAFFFNPWTPLLFFLSVIALQLLFSRINWKLWSLLMLPFFLGAFGYFWTTLVFGADTGGPVLWSYGFVEISEENLTHAWSLSLRVLAFSSLSLLFALTTEPVRFIQSLMQQCKLSPKLAYSVMVSYQFLPVLKAELEQIQQAHRLRGAHIEKHWWNRLVAMHRLFIPILAGAVRKAERAAFAMEARGFTGEPRTSFYEQLTIKRTDYVLTAVFGVVLVLCCSVVYLDF